MTDHQLDPAAEMVAIDAGATNLDGLTKLLDQAVDTLDEAEARWDEVADKVADALKDEMLAEGRKGDPAQHWVETQARKENRVAYQNFRRAKRAVTKVEQQIRSVSAAMNGRQSVLGGLRDEARAPTQYQQPVQQQYTGPRRAAG